MKLEFQYANQATKAERNTVQELKELIKNKKLAKTAQVSLNYVSQTSSNERKFVRKISKVKIYADQKPLSPKRSMEKSSPKRSIEKSSLPCQSTRATSRLQNQRTYNCNPAQRPLTSQTSLMQKESQDEVNFRSGRFNLATVQNFDRKIFSARGHRKMNFSENLPSEEPSVQQIAP